MYLFILFVQDDRISLGTLEGPWLQGTEVK